MTLVVLQVSRGADIDTTDSGSDVPERTCASRLHYKTVLSANCVKGGNLLKVCTDYQSSQRSHDLVDECVVRCALEPACLASIVTIPYKGVRMQLARTATAISSQMTSSLFFLSRNIKSAPAARLTCDRSSSHGP